MRKKLNVQNSLFAESARKIVIGKANSRLVMTHILEAVLSSIHNFEITFVLFAIPENYNGIEIFEKYSPDRFPTFNID